MAHKGTSTFVMQRASAVLMLPLAVWFLISLVAHAGDSFADMRVWLAQPTTSVPFALFILIGVFHGRIGIMEVIADYIHTSTKGLLIALSWAFAIAVALVTVLAVYKLSFAG